MGLRNTANDNKVALFDSTDGIAFGPTFDSEQEADDFIVFAEEVHGVEDVRTLTAEQLAVVYNTFNESQEGDADGE